MYKKRVDIKKKQKKGRKKIMATFIVLTCFVLFSGISVALSLVVIYTDSIYKGIYVEDVNVGGLSVIEAMRKIEENINDVVENNKLILTYGDKVWTFTNKELGIKYDLAKAINEAFFIGRKGNYLKRFSTVIELLQKPQIISLRFSVDMDKLNSIIQRIEKEVNRPGKEATIERKDGKFIIHDEVLGLKLNRNKTIKSILESLRNSSYDDIVEVNLPVETIPTKYTSEMLSQISDLLGSHTTTFNSRLRGRSQNIYIASASINGTVLLPGEIFSFNNVVGPRTAKNGYKTAPIIFKGKLIDGIGGGVCQVSSTIYNSVLKSELGVIERVNHTIPSTYVPMGLDATVSYGAIDLKFQNTTDYPIYIESFVKGNNLTVNIYGHKTSNRTVKLVSKVDEVIKRDTEIVFDSELQEGEEIIRDKGRDGYKVSAYMVFYENGKEVGRKLISKDYYRPRRQVVVKGTKKEQDSKHENVNNDDSEEIEDNNN